MEIGLDATIVGNYAIIFSICTLLVPRRLVLGTLVLKNGSWYSIILYIRIY